MGDRVSIQFRNGKALSVVLFSHWDGMGFVEAAKKYAKLLKEETKDSMVTPLDRREPDTVMIDFIGWYLKGQRVKSNYYLGASENDGDNSDNGHHIIGLEAVV